MWNSSMELTEDTKNSSLIKTSSNNKGSIEVGIIVMGMSCVCVVACALIILQLRSSARQRQRRRRQRSSTVNIIMNEEDPYQSLRLPTYEAVIRSPHLYPPSPRSSLASVISISSTRTASTSSNPYKVTATATATCSQVPVHSPVMQNNSSSALELEDLEEPPPSYPEILASTYTDIIYSNHRSSCYSNSEEIHEVQINDNNINGSTTENHINGNSHQTIINCNDIPQNSRQNRGSSYGNETYREIRLPNNSYHRNSVQGIGGDNQESETQSRRRSSRVRSVSIICSLLPSQTWDHCPRELSFVTCQSNTQACGISPSHDC